MRGVGRIRSQENKPALGYISSPVYVKAARTGNARLNKRTGKGERGETKRDRGRKAGDGDGRRERRCRNATRGRECGSRSRRETKRRGEKRNGWRRWLQESKLRDFEFQSIKLLAFRRAVVATVTTAVVRSSSSPLLSSISLSSLALFFLSHPFLFFSLSPLRPPSFFPVSSLPPASKR